VTDGLVPFHLLSGKAPQGNSSSGLEVMCGTFAPWPCPSSWMLSKSFGGKGTQLDLESFSTGSLGIGFSVYCFCLPRDHWCFIGSLLFMLQEDGPHNQSASKVKSTVSSPKMEWPENMVVSNELSCSSHFIQSGWVHYLAVLDLCTQSFERAIGFELI